MPNFWPDELESATMRDWTGSRVREDAQAVMCPYCHAPIGQTCVNADKPLKAFPAHEVRIRAAKRKADA